MGSHRLLGRLINGLVYQTPVYAIPLPAGTGRWLRMTVTRLMTAEALRGPARRAGCCATRLRRSDMQTWRG